MAIRNVQKSIFANSRAAQDYLFNAIKTPNNDLVSVKTTANDSPVKNQGEKISKVPHLIRQVILLSYSAAFVKISMGCCSDPSLRLLLRIKNRQVIWVSFFFYFFLFIFGVRLEQDISSVYPWLIGMLRPNAIIISWWIKHAVFSWHWPHLANGDLRAFGRGHLYLRSEPLWTTYILACHLFQCLCLWKKWLVCASISTNQAGPRLSSTWEFYLGCIWNFLFIKGNSPGNTSGTTESCNFKFCKKSSKFEEMQSVLVKVKEKWNEQGLVVLCDEFR